MTTTSEHAASQITDFHEAANNPGRLSAVMASAETFARLGERDGRFMGLAQALDGLWAAMVTRDYRQVRACARRAEEEAAAIALVRS
jgi:hypothetical protein